MDVGRGVMLFSSSSGFYTVRIPGHSGKAPLGAHGYRAIRPPGVRIYDDMR